MLTRLRRAVDAAIGELNAAARTSVERGMSNERHGIGGARDPVSSTVLELRTFDKAQLEILYRQFWTAERAIDLKPDDIFGPGITWTEDAGSSATDRMEDELKRLEVMRFIPKAVKAARLYGTAIVILAPTDGDFERPLDPEAIAPGEISHLLVVDRYSLEDLIFYGDPRQTKFGQVYMYRWNFHPVEGEWLNETAEHVLDASIDIHASRCLRFDGIEPLTVDGWEAGGDDRWGLSVLNRSASDIVQDAVGNASLVDIVQRTAMLVVKMQGFRDFLAQGGESEVGEASPEDYIERFGKDIQEALAVFIDKQDEIGKVEVHSAGVQEIVSKQVERLAMIEGVPITRFTGESATGLNATGDGDAQDWRITLESYRERSIDPQFNLLMDIVARNIGIAETPEWKWNDLGEATFTEDVESAKGLSETAAALLGANAIDESEARVIMNNSTLFDLEKDWDPPPLPVPAPMATGQKPAAAGATKPQGGAAGAKGQR